MNDLERFFSSDSAFTQRCIYQISVSSVPRSALSSSRLANNFVCHCWMQHVTSSSRVCKLVFMPDSDACKPCLLHSSAEPRVPFSHDVTSPLLLVTFKYLSDFNTTYMALTITSSSSMVLLFSSHGVCYATYVDHRSRPHSWFLGRFHICGGLRV